MATLPNNVSQPRMASASWTNSDSALTKKAVLLAGLNGSKITAVLATSTDTSNRVFSLYFLTGGTSYLLGSATVTAASGSDGATSTVNLLSLIPGLPTDNDGQVYLLLPGGTTLQAMNVTQVTAAKEVDVTAIGGDF